MDNLKAKFILRAYRPSGKDAGDARFCPALRQANADPALAGWLREEQEFDCAVAERLRALAPPPGLRDSILAGAAVSQPTRRMFRPGRWLTVAACIAAVVATGLLLLAPAGNRDPHDFRDFALAYVHSGIDLEFLDSDTQELREWLQRKNTIVPARFPGQIAPLEGIGCRTLEFDGQRVALVCFGNGTALHLFIAPRPAFTSALSETPEYSAQADWVTASWSDADFVYVLVGSGRIDDLKDYL